MGCLVAPAWHNLSSVCSVSRHSHASNQETSVTMPNFALGAAAAIWSCHLVQKACKGMQPTVPAGFQDFWGPAAVVPEAEQLAGLGHLPGHLLRQCRPFPARSGTDSGRRIRLWVSSETSGTLSGPGSPSCHGPRQVQATVPGPDCSRRCCWSHQTPATPAAVSSQAWRPDWCFCTRAHVALCCPLLACTRQRNTFTC